ncbi:MAG: trans-sulfuration enzyme family protein [Xanthobacteraceae bacterium]
MLGAGEPATKGVVPPVHVATTYIRDADNQYRSGFAYGRPDNATVRQAEAVIAALECGEEALLFASGMAAATAVVLALDPPAHIVAPRQMYWALRQWLVAAAPRYGYRVDLADMTDLDAVRRAISRETRLVWIETPSNPLWSVTDIAAVAGIAHAAGARLAIDSTVATPVFTRPLTLGADIVMHSATKYLNGHSDMVGGMLVVGDDKELEEQLTFLQNAVGGVQGPFDSFLALRGLKTLHLRMRAHCENAGQIAEWLSKHPKIDKVAYPGLKAHPQHELAKKQMDGFGGMVSVWVKGGEDAARRVMERTELFACAESLGGVESLVNHPAIMTHASVPPDRRKALGVDDNLVRFSVGVEHIDDLRADIENALA